MAKGSFPTKYVAVRNIWANTVEVTFLQDSFFTADFQKRFSAADNTDLFML